MACGGWPKKRSPKSKVKSIKLTDGAALLSRPGAPALRPFAFSLLREEISHRSFLLAALARGVACDLREEGTRFVLLHPATGRLRENGPPPLFGHFHLSGT